MLNSQAPQLSASSQPASSFSIKLTEYLNGKTLDEAVAKLEQEIKKEPAVVEKRFFLFQLMAVLGRWERALQQLQTCVKLGKALAATAHVYGDLVRTETMRAKVFAGEVTPRFLQEPSAWCAGVVQALALQAQNRIDEADQARSAAFDQVPECSGTLNTPDGQHNFAWLVDADSRLGPILEVILNGQYMWLAMDQVKSIEVAPPHDLRDLVWTIAEITLKEGDTVSAFIPTRYPQSETADDATRLARTTTWREVGATATIGLGQRIWMTDAQDVALFDCRKIAFN
jgi:type VI secretion system protein ImpE